MRRLVGENLFWWEQSVGCMNMGFEWLGGCLIAWWKEEGMWVHAISFRFCCIGTDVDITEHVMAKH